MKYKYTGTDERVFPSLGVVVTSGAEFEAPEGFTAPDVEIASSASKTTTIKPTPNTAQESE